jgi:CheY-like chemotaxis protein
MNVEHAIVVDDDPVIRSILRSTLAGIGVGVHCASDGKEALVVAGRVRADLFLLDLRMPGMNGLEACRALRSVAGYAQTPVVVLTGHANEEAQEASFAAGADMFLTKPFRPAALLLALEPILRGGTAGDVADIQTQDAGRAELWGQTDPESRKQLWGQQDAKRTAALLAGGGPMVGIE